MCKFCELTRAYSLPMSISAFLVAFTAAYKLTPEVAMGQFWLNSILLLVAISVLHLAGNLYDDYKDVTSKLKQGLSFQEINFRNAMKARLILDGTYSLCDVKKILAIMLLIPLLIGVYFIISLQDLNILVLMIITALLGAFYPKSSKCGLSEVVIGILFGPMLVCSSYYVLMHYFSFRIYNFSMAIGIFTAILLIAHSIMDYEYDSNNGKKTLPVLLKNKYNAINLLLILILLGAGIYLYTKISFCMSPVFYIPILCIIPVAKKLISSMTEYIEIKNVSFVPKWYWGIMENWEKIVQTGAQYFMFRFYLARNLALIFNISLAICLFYAFDPIRDMFFMDLSLLMKTFGF